MKKGNKFLIDEFLAKINIPVEKKWAKEVTNQLIEELEMAKINAEDCINANQRNA